MLTTSNDDDRTEIHHDNNDQNRTFSHQVKIDGEVKLTKKHEYTSIANYSLIGLLVILIFVLIYLLLFDFSTNSQMTLKKNESIFSYIEELRENNININYRFVDPSNPTESNAGIIMKSVIINTDAIDKNDYVTIYLGSR